VIPVKGWKKYSKINLQYDNQIVASILGVEEQVADSLKTMKMIKEFAEYSARMSSDTTSKLQPDNAENSVSESMILNSIARDDEPEESITLPVEKLNTTINPTAKSEIKSVGNKEKKSEDIKAPVTKKETKKEEKPLNKNTKKEEKKSADKTKTNKATKPKEKKPMPKAATNDY
jgi:hypothetical protein